MWLTRTALVRPTKVQPGTVQVWGRLVAGVVGSGCPGASLLCFSWSLLLASSSSCEQFNSWSASRTNPRQVPRSCATSCQSESRPQILKSRRTTSFHLLFWPPAARLPTCGRHTRRHLGRRRSRLLITRISTLSIFCRCNLPRVHMVVQGWVGSLCLPVHAKRCRIAVPNNLVSREGALRSCCMLTLSFTVYSHQHKGGCSSPQALPPGYATACEPKARACQGSSGPTPKTLRNTLGEVHVNQLTSTFVLALEDTHTHA